MSKFLLYGKTSLLTKTFYFRKLVFLQQGMHKEQNITEINLDCFFTRELGI